MSSDTVLTRRELNRTVLARQHLLERVRKPIPEVLAGIGGVQAQYAPSAYVGLWSRLEGFRRPDLNEALEDRSVVQGTLMRVTIHLVSAADYFRFAAAVRTARREWWLGATRGAFDEVRLSDLARRTGELVADGPRKRSELLKELGIDNTAFIGVGLWIDLLRVPPSGTWEHRRADLYARADRWLGPSDPSPEEGTDHLVRRYLEAFGPARLADISSWSGLPPATISASLGRLTLRRFRDEQGKELVDLADRELSGPDAEAPPRLLGTWDALLLAHTRRAGILPEHHRPRVFSTKNPQSVNTFLVDGSVAGAWRFDGGSVSLQPFEELGPEVRAAVEREARDITDLS